MDEQSSILLYTSRPRGPALSCRQQRVNADAESVLGRYAYWRGSSASNDTAALGAMLQNNIDFQLHRSR